MACTEPKSSWRTVLVPAVAAVALASASLSALSADTDASPERRGIVVDATVTDIRLDLAGGTPTYRIDYVFTPPGRRGTIAGRGWIPACRIDALGPGGRLAVLVDPLEPRRSEPWVSGSETGEPQHGDPPVPVPVPAPVPAPVPVPLALIASGTGGAAMRTPATAPDARPREPDKRLALDGS